MAHAHAQQGRRFVAQLIVGTAMLTCASPRQWMNVCVCVCVRVCVCVTQELRWGPEGAADVARLPHDTPYDLIVGSDLIYYTYRWAMKHYAVEQRAVR